MHYVSKYNYVKSLSRLSNAHMSKPNMSEAVAGLSRFSLRDILTDDEILSMYQQKNMLAQVKEWVDSGVTVDADAIRADLEKRERYFVREFVMKVNTPRYHAELDCEFLRASFENFKTPPEISKRGEDEVREFQEFCDKEWPRYRNSPTYIFWAHVGSHFRVSIAPEAVSYLSNEGAESVDDLSEQELLDAIYRQASTLRTYAKSNGLGSYLCEPPKKLFARTKDTKLEEDRRLMFIELLKLKKGIKMLVFHVHRIELEMPEGLLSDELLHALGFLPCKACCGQR